MRTNRILYTAFIKKLEKLFRSPPDVAKPAFLRLKYKMINRPDLVEPLICKTILHYSKLYDIQDEHRIKFDKIDNDENHADFADIEKQMLDKLSTVEADVDLEYSAIVGE